MIGRLLAAPTPREGLVSLYAELREIERLAGPMPAARFAVLGALADARGGA